MIFKVALTGGIGSGKSTAADYFHELGAPIIDSDKIARELTLPGSPAFDKIIDHFGDLVLKGNRELDRKKLREIIFNDNKEKQWLESLLHPLIIKEMKSQIQKIHYPYCILVIPLLVESNLPNFFDRVLVIDLPVEIQIERAKHRDQATQQSIELIIESQSQRDKRLAMANDIILNDSDLNSLRNKVQTLHFLYLQLAKNKEMNHEW